MYTSLVVSYGIKLSQMNCGIDHLHLSGVDERHVGNGYDVTMATQSHGENGFHVGLVETRESSSGIRRFHLRHGHVPVK